MHTRSRVLKIDGGLKIETEEAFLLVEEGPDEGREVRLRDTPVILGRGDTADFVLKDGTVSREHAILVPKGASWKIRDLESKAGTFVNGIRVDSAEVPSGAKIQLGATVITLHRQMLQVPVSAHQEPRFEGMIGSGPAMRELFGMIDKLAPLDLPILLQGESGTGKERLARAIHQRSNVSEGPYEIVDCTLLGEGEHLRSELFGHTKGAFTGADSARKGAFERAHGGTLFLDEIGELPLAFQPQLLRVLEEGEVRPLGGNTTARVRVRVVCASHKNLEEMVSQGSFREDLFYRLSALILRIPPLRERGDDVLELGEHFLPRGLSFSPGARAALRAYSFPGNVRELRNRIQRASALAQGSTLEEKDLDLGGVGSPGTLPTMEPAKLQSGGGLDWSQLESSPDVSGEDDVDLSQSISSQLENSGRLQTLEVEAIVDALRRFKGSRTKAARYLGISRSTLFRRMRDMNILEYDFRT